SVLGCGEQRLDLALGEKILRPARQIVRLRPCLGGTLTFTAAGWGCHGLAFPGQITRPSLSLFPFLLGQKGKSQRRLSKYVVRTSATSASAWRSLVNASSSSARDNSAICPDSTGGLDSTLALVETCVNVHAT